MGATPAGNTVRIGLDWFLNPDHLAFIAARDWPDLAAEPLTIVLDEPNQHGDGFAALAGGVFDLIVTEPLTLLEPMASACEPLGCVFETSGGILIREDRLKKLRAGEIMRIASPMSGRLTDGLCRRILQRWAGNQGVAIAETQIAVEQADFRHVENLEAGFDACWLAFANIEAVQARQRGLSVRLLTAEDVGLPGFSALELVARKGRSAEEIALHERFIAALEAAALRLRADEQAAVSLWQSASGEGGSDAREIVIATLACLKAPVDRTPTRWHSLESLLLEA
ncbi:MAG: ABC transporter substrate-binding protein [Rhodospirillales bacterium]|nr:ABC transporter substrate-binding protein [Rhodospirillales bacterium]